MGRASHPVTRLARGCLAGVAGTTAMDAVWYVRYRSAGGREGPLPWEFSLTGVSWDDAPAPARMARIVVHKLTGRQIPERHLELVDDVTHWGYGTSMGGLYGLVFSHRGGIVGGGLLWGLIVWSSSYVVLPAAGVYKPIWRYDLTTLAKDLSAHLAFGLGTATAFALTARITR